MKKYIYILFFLLVTTTASAQNFQPRECTEGEIPSSSRSKYYREAQRFLEDYYYQLQGSVGSSENKNVVLEDVIADRNKISFKTEFSLSLPDNLVFCSPAQYLIEFEKEYMDTVDDIEFVVDNIHQGKIMMYSLISCYIPMEYDLTLMQEDKVIFKRRCLMHVCFPSAIASNRVKVLQVEPIKDIIAYSPISTTSHEKLYRQAEQWYELGLNYKNGKNAFEVDYHKAYSLLKSAMDYAEQYKEDPFYKESYDKIHAEFLDVRMKLDKTPEKLMERLRADSSNPYMMQVVEHKLYDSESRYTKRYQATLVEHIKEINSESPAIREKGWEGLNNLAEYGLPQAMVKVAANHYEKGDFRKAYQMYAAAAMGNLPDAYNGLGDCYFYGKHVNQDYSQAIMLYTQAAKMDRTITRLELARCYERGLGVEKSDSLAVLYYQNVAEAGNAEAMARVGEYYHKGELVQKDHARAAHWFELAAAKGNLSSMDYLGSYYYKGIHYVKNIPLGVEWYTKAAEQGYLYSQFALGIHYYDSKDYSKALAWFLKAAHQGHLPSMNLVGYLYREQKTEEGYRESFKWWSKAAEHGYASAQHNLGWNYYNGKGVAQSKATAIKLWLKAAKNLDMAIKTLEDIKREFKSKRMGIVTKANECSGIVYGANNQPLADAFVYVDGTNIVAVTDILGRFFIENLKDGDVIRFEKLNETITKVTHKQLGVQCPWKFEWN